MVFNECRLFCFVVYIEIINNNEQKTGKIRKKLCFEKICIFVYL